MVDIATKYVNCMHAKFSKGNEVVIRFFKTFKNKQHHVNVTGWKVFLVKWKHAKVFLQN